MRERIPDGEGTRLYQCLQPAQLEEAQEEQPLDMEWVLPSLERDTPLKLE